MFFPSDSSVPKNPRNPTTEPTNGGFRRSKTDLHLAFQNYYARESPAKNCWGRPRTESQIKMRLYQWAPKKPMKETSEGVQQIIDQVSVMLEKSDETKEVSGSTLDGTPEDSFPKLDDSTTEGFKKVSTSVENEIDIAKNLIKFLEKSNMDQNRSVRKSESVLENSQGWVSTVETKPEVEDPPRKHIEERELESSSSSKSKVGQAGEGLSRKETSLSAGRRDDVIAPTKRESKAGLASRRKPSEIPLRKPTPPPKSPPRKTKPVSLLIQKPLDKVDSVNSFEISQRKKCIAPIRELGDENSRAATEGKSDVNEEGKHGGEVSNDIRLNKCIKSSDIPVSPDSESENLTESRPGSDCRTKKLNLEKVKSSSLTALKGETLNRLESLHHQNVCSKVNSLLEKDSSTKMKTLGTKVSFNALRGKGSKKNLSARLSSKGNKLSLNIKEKVKKELKENSPLEKSTEENAEVSKQEIFRNAGSRTYRKENPTDEGNLERASKAYRKPKTVEGLMRVRGAKTPVDAKKKNSDFPKPEILKSPNSDPSIAFEKEPEEILFSTPVEGIKKEEDSLIMQSPEGGNETEKLEPSNCLPPEDYKPVEGETESFGLPSKSFIISSSSKQKLREEKLGSFAKRIQERNKSDKDKPEGTKPKGKKLKDDKFVLKKKTTPSLKMKTMQFQDLVVKGTALKFLNEELPLKPREEVVNFQVDTKIDLSPEERFESLDGGANTSKKACFTFDWLFMSPEKYNEELYVLRESSNDSDSNEDDTKDESLLPVDVKPLGSEAVDSALKKCCGSSSSLKRKVTCKTSALNPKSMTKKLRSDAGDRRLVTGYFNSSLSFQNKVKPDAKLRSGLTKSYREAKVSSEKKDIFEDTSALKLRRRNSEPHSFRGFVWKRADLATPRGNKTSASSMASSLRHLNTDDLEDFIFWEVVPQKVTQCWETSLYQFKRPWSVLSCSVFKDNRQSSTPGLILANLRNGGPFTPSKHPPTSERVSCPQENSFDVEPSIAQKNIDIRNWLAALNFPTIPSTSNDVISEGSCCSQSSIVALNLSKNQVSPKRRNVLTGLKFPDEVIENKVVNAEKFNESTKWSEERLEPNLMDLIRKSGTFVSSRDISNPEISTGDKASDYCSLLKPQEPEKQETAEEKERGDADGSNDGAPVAEAGFADSYWTVLGRVFTGHLSPFPSDFNVWKYLFLITLCFFTVYYSLLAGDHHLP